MCIRDRPQIQTKTYGGIVVMTSGLTAQPLITQFRNSSSTYRMQPSLEVSILDLNNNVLFTQEYDTSNVQIPNLNLTAGQYLLQVIFNGEQQVQLFEIL